MFDTPFPPHSTTRRYVRNVPLRTCVSGILALVAAGVPVAGHAEAPAGSAGASGGMLDDIVVTATRRQESIDRIPISVSAFSQDAMDQSGIKTVDDIARFTPGLTFAPSTDGLTNAIAIRGIASGVGASTTGIYIDDTPIQIRSGTGVVTENAYPRVFDLERVEVLRGPQGTLFGTGSMGGAIRFITPEPDLHRYSGAARAELGSTRGGDPSYEVGVAAGGPIADGTLGFRVSAFYEDAGGFIDRQPFTGTTVTGKGLNSNRTTALRGSLKWSPSDSVVVLPSIAYQEVRRNDNYFWTSISDPSASDFRTGFTQPQPSRDSFTLPSLKVIWSLPGAELISNTSFFYRSLKRDSDYSNYLWFALVGDPTPTDPLPTYRAVSQAAVRQNSFTQEIRVQSTDAASRIKWVVGALFQSSRLYTNQYVYDPQLPQLSSTVYEAPIEDIFGEGLVDGLYSATIDQWARDKQTAVFGQVDVAFTDRIKGTFGLRIARTSLDFHREFGGPLLCNLCNGSTEVTGGSTPN
ncbi:MAG: TonB-dependent receptor plug domain-containing protein, partial [Pseudomonadota bacterium]